ncbi:AraC-type DNA-binding domain-containing protein [Candidatus Moduliflexus flocculans]|uniref:AraC-type DNA-binding domain-containing protein n=1 Tax=Candidatus Moduliflexus flocculans TaxID=1499966 RepID=A0A081BLX4_9BACT|nr:AraC-type DNA-binding domain-containing protein [Candidatus Moduliflexus flocculans]
MITPYQPIQPMLSLRQQPGFRKQNVAPDIRLRPYIFCYWTMYSVMPLQMPCEIHGVPDGCIDIFLHCHNFRTTYLLGIAESSRLLPAPERIRYFGIRFLPGQIHHFFPLPTDGLYDQLIAAHDIIGKTFQEIEEQLLLARSFHDQISIVEALLFKLLVRRTYQPDARFMRMLRQIYAQNGQISIEQLAKEEQISVRHLHRIFQTFLGLGAKKFSRIVRFQHILQQIVSGKNNPFVDLALDHGYFDQAHFINDFRQMYGTSPSSLIIS